MRPVGAHQLEVAFETARCKNHEIGPELVRLSAALIDRMHSYYAAGLDHQPRDLRVPDERKIRIPQTFAINWADQADAASLGDVLAAHTVAGDDLRKQFPMRHPKVVQPIVHLAPRVLRIESYPVSVGIFAKLHKIPAGQLHRINDLARLLLGSPDHAHHAAGHHSVPAKNRCHVDERDTSAGTRGFQPRAQTGDARADDDDVWLRARYRGRWVCLDWSKSDRNQQKGRCNSQEHSRPACTKALEVQSISAKGKG